MSRTRRRVLAVLGVLALAGAGVGAYLRYSRLSVAGHLKAANAEAARREFKLAAGHLDTYLAARPDDLDARLFAAQLARRRSEFGAMTEHLKVHRQKGGPEAPREFERRCREVQEGDTAEGEKLLAEHADNLPAVEAVILGCLTKLRGRSGQMSRLPAGPDDPRVQLARRAADAWMKSCKEKADRLQGLVWRGRVNAAGGEYEAALADFRGALADDPAFSEARLHLAMTLMQADPAGALDHLRGLRQARPDDADVLSALAAGYMAFGRIDDARSALNEAAAKKPDDLFLVLDLGLLELEANRPAEAEKHLRQLLARGPAVPSIYLAMSRCMTLSGKPDEAKKFRDRYEELEVLAKRPWRYPKP